jgi:hypothetical protein
MKIEAKVVAKDCGPKVEKFFRNGVNALTLGCWKLLRFQQRELGNLENQRIP